MKIVKPFRIRFIGRFVFAVRETKKESDRMVTALALNMGFNPDLGNRPHRVLLSAARNKVQARGACLGDFTTFAPADDLGPHHQLQIWDLDGHDVTPALSSAEAGAMKLASTWNGVTDLRKHAPKAKFDKTLLEDAPSALVSARIKLTGGTLSSRAFDESTYFSFERLGKILPTGPFKDRLNDVVEVAFNAESPLVLDIVRRSDHRLGSISAPGSESGDKALPTTLTFTNLCTVTDTEDDPEFAAFYDVLEGEVPRAFDRMVPYRDRAAVEGSRIDCSHPARVAYA